MGFGLSSITSVATSVSTKVSDVTSKAGSLKNAATSKLGSVQGTVGGLKDKASGLSNKALSYKDKITGKLSSATGSFSGGTAGGVSVGPGTSSSTGYLFSVEIDGCGQMRFEECSGLEISTDIVEVEEGGFNAGTHKFYGATHYGNVVLRKGVAYCDNALFDMINGCINMQEASDNLTASISVRKLCDTEDEIARWTLYGIRPCRWSIGKLVSRDKYAVEYIELSVRSVECE